MGDSSHPQQAGPVQISPHIKLQPPLSRLGHGPGLVLVLDHYALIEKSEKHLDPPPLQKWAEEGFAVAQMLVPGKAEDGGEFNLQKAIDALTELEGCDKGPIGIISYLTRIPFYVEEGICHCPNIEAIISYGDRKFTPIGTGVDQIPPQLLHISGPEQKKHRRESVVPEPNFSSIHQPPKEGAIKTFRYVNATPESAWILPSDEDYHAASASLAHTRSLAFLKPLLGGPDFDLEAIWDEHCKYEFGVRDVEATMNTMVAEPYVNHIPTMTGGVGRERLTAFYTKHFIFSNPQDTELELVSRTVGVDRVIDEFVFKLTHDRVVDWLLPGVPPTGKYLQIPFTSIVAMRGDRLCHEHISWDQASALQQAGLLPEWAPFPFPIDGKEPAQGRKFEVRLPVVGVETAKKLVEESSVESNELIERESGKGWREVDA